MIKANKSMFYLYATLKWITLTYIATSSVTIMHNKYKKEMKIMTINSRRNDPMQ